MILHVNKDVSYYNNTMNRIGRGQCLRHQSIKIYIAPLQDPS